MTTKLLMPQRLRSSMTDIQSSREDQYSREEIAQFISFAGSSTCLLLCAFSLTPYMGFSFVVVAMACFGATNSGVGCAFLDVSLRYSSTIYTLANLGGAIAGLALHFSCRFRAKAVGWQVVFVFTAVQCWVALFFWYQYQTSNGAESVTAQRYCCRPWPGSRCGPAPTTSSAAGFLRCTRQPW